MFKRFFAKLFEYGTADRSRYRLAYCFGFAMHIFFLIIYSVLEVLPLIIFNIFSVILYFTGSIFVSANIKRVFWAILLYIEILTHSVTCCIVIGWTFGFSMYCMTIIPIMYFLLYMDDECRHPIKIATVLASVNLAVMFIARIYCYSHEPIYQLSSWAASFMSVLNMVLSDLLLALFSLLFLLKISSDKRVLENQNNDLIFLANYDALTKLRNRHHMAETFNEFEKGTAPYCMILGDIDDFKQVNDTFGHHAGDVVLQTVSGIIKKHVGDLGTVCRWGGEEILLIVYGSTAECLEMNESIRREIENTRIRVENHAISVTMTFGFCDYSDAATVEKLITIADKRLYIGKNRGKNCIVSK